MKIQAITLAATAVTAAAAKHQQLPTEIAATSDLGRSLLSQARRLDGDEDEDANTWIVGYSLKFQGCRHHASLNLDADDEDDVKVQTSKLAHFRLCPSDSCEGWLGGGCKSGYGDYVVDLATFAQAHVEGARRSEEYQCQMYVYENCDCQETDDKDDNFDRDYCEYDCYAAAKKDMMGCVDRNPYDEEEDGSRDERFEAQEYAECKEWEIPESDDDDGNNRRKLDEEEEEIEYYIGPYCSANGGAVYLGLYTDDTCTNFADENSGKDTFLTLSGGALPYSSTSLITSDCISCVDQEDPNRRDDEDDDGEQAPEVSDQCERLYESAGKCESSINVASSGMTSSPNNAACSYIDGIKFTKVNGIVDVKYTSKTATFFVVAFAAIFIGLAGVVFNLKKKIDEAKKSPLLEKEDSQEDQPALS